MFDLSILITARNEQWLARTIRDILENIRANTEIICVLDGYWPNPGIEDHPRLTLLRYPQSIGQRAAINQAARVSTAKFIMKADAHCSFAPGFDAELMGSCEYNQTTIPRQYNLHVFDWLCLGCGKQTYQGPRPASCEACASTDFEQVEVWQPRYNRRADFMRFDNDLHFQYWGDFGKRPEAQADIAPTLSLLGACWLLHRTRYWELGGLDEGHGSWGQMGTELACKSWLSGGQLVVNKRTWYAHLFRTRPGFGFPYPLSGPDVEQARNRSRYLWLGSNWSGAKYPLSWLIEKFWPVPGWSEADLDNLKSKSFKIKQPTKGIVYYTDSRLAEPIFSAVQNQIKRSANGHQIVSVSLKPLEFGQNIKLELERGYLTMFRQILAGLEACEADIIFLCEHDVLYHPSHFDFTPIFRSKVYYNTNVWHVRANDGHAVTYTAKRVSQLCAYRDVLIEHYRRRVALVEANGFSRKMGFEPGSHGRAERVDDLKSDTWQSAYPNIDIKHNQNLTPARWSPEQFRDQRNCRNWREAGEVPGWGVTGGRFYDLLEGL